MGRKAWERRGRETKRTVKGVWERHCWFRKCSHTNTAETDTSLEVLRDRNVEFPISYVMGCSGFNSFVGWDIFKLSYGPHHGYSWGCCFCEGQKALVSFPPCLQIYALSDHVNVAFCSMYGVEMQCQWRKSLAFSLCRQKSQSHYFPMDLFKSVLSW